MVIILYISALIAAVAFGVLVIFLARTLTAVRRTMNNVADTLEGVEKQLEGMTLETTELLSKTNKLAEDVGDKSQKLNTLVDGVKGIGDSLLEFSQSIRSISRGLSHSAQDHNDSAAQAMKWGQVAINLWKKSKKDDLNQTGG
ncbi:DUF948 domain-containing protein [Halobacillus sp. Marseille-P3879]|uniref:DUF948 domain-containing protein n=1 Tax=Halobacillus TaxID=45667 RepID=UPI000C79937F|nr:DUF948 domain-containing protein [Halobacillus sp. Marseille-P3879]